MENGSTQRDKRLESFRNVCICGGTHGNELTGVYLVKHWQRNPSAIERVSFKTHLCLTNTKAVEKCVRYIHADLNRESFNPSVISMKQDDEKYESLRAQELVKCFVAKNVDFIIDLHNTTSNMGVSLMVHHTDARLLHILATVQEILPFPARVLVLPDPPQGAVLGDACTGGVTSYTECGIGVEIGPLAHGTLNAELFQQTEKVVQEILSLIAETNNGKKFPEWKVEVYKMREPIHYPRDQHGEITCLIHPELDGRDWEPLSPGDPVFMTFDGETVVFDGPGTIYPVFINEPAYLEIKKDTAFWATEKMTLHLPEM